MAGNQADQAVRGIGEEETPKRSQELDGQEVVRLTALLSEKLSSFESEGLSDILDELAEYQYYGNPLRELADEIRSLSNDFDYLGASEVLEAWQRKNGESAL